jgi:regulatory protein
VAPLVDAEREERRAHAFDVAWRQLGHRDRTEAEIVRAFLKARVEPELAEEVIGELREGGYVDDAQFARRFVEDRRRLDAWGGERIERRLGELGVAAEHVQAALGEGSHDELDAAVALLARRFPAPPATPRERDRALAVLLRKGYELELAHDALRRFAAAPVD